MDNEENKEQIDEEFDESLERVEVDNNFGGYFHERDSLTENNIVVLKGIEQNRFLTNLFD